VKILNKAQNNTTCSLALA